MCDRLRLFGRQQKNRMCEQLVRSLADKDFEPFKFRKMVTSSGNCEKMLSQESENREKRNWLI